MSAHEKAIPPSSGRAKLKDRAFRTAMLSCLGLSILLLVVLLVDVGADGLGVIDTGFLLDYASSDTDRAGLRSALLGTIWLMGVCAVFIVPVGVATAVYLEEYADGTRWWNKLVEVNVQNLAAVPSIVYGILGLAFLVRGPAAVHSSEVRRGATASRERHSRACCCSAS